VTALSSRARVWAALRGEPLDRPPVSFWGHVYHRESSASELVEHTLERQREYRWDWVKLNPRKHYHVEDWGVRYRYSGRPNEKPILEDWPIHAPEDWGRVTERPPERGVLGEQIEAVRLLRQGLDSDVPFVATVFTPLAVLAEMVPEPQTLHEAMGTHPNQVRRALEAVTATYERFVPLLLEAGADGIFFATTDWGSRNQISADEHRSWSRPYDDRILAVMSGAPFNVLHVCKSNAMLFELADYPVSAFSYDATDASNPSLAQALARVPGAVMGGISYEDALQDPSPQRLRGELARGLEQTNGRRWLIAPGCSIPPTTPAANLHAIRDAVDALAQAAAPPVRGTRS
jgi:uroporphyrinogen decarboxylase